MEGKNVLLAIVLSTVVLVIWATFFEPPPLEKQISEQEIVESVESNEDISSPSVENVEIIQSATRKEIINKTNRIVVIFLV